MIKNNRIIIISLIIVFCSLCIDLIPNISLDTKFKLIVYIFTCILVFIDMKIKNKKLTKIEDKEKNRKKGLIIIFIIYSILIVTLLLVDSNYRRFGFSENIKLFSKEHFEYYSNFIPFKTMYDFGRRIMEGTINTSIVITNIIGNIIVFAPFGIFIPMIFKNKFENIKNFTLLMVIIVLMVESIQFITRCGAFDIDDIILNVLGAEAVFGLMKIDSVRKIVDIILK